MVAVRKISSDCTALAYAIEESITVLPASPVWRRLSPNAYPGEFGANVEFMDDRPLGSGRASKKGIPVNKTVPAGFESSLRQDWLQPFLPGFFFNKAIESPNTATFNRTATSATLTAVSGTGYTGTNFNAANGFENTNDTKLLLARGFATPANNGLKPMTGLSATSISASGLTAETSPPPDASVSVCGVIVSDSAAATSVSGGELTVVSSSLALGGDLEVAPGTFLHIGGDTTTSRYANRANTGWVRVSRVTSTGFVCDITDFYQQSPPTTIASPGTTIQIYLPTRIYKDQIECDDSLRTTYQLERRLGKGDTTDAYEQAQLVVGAVCNQLDISIPTSNKVMATLNFVCAESYRRDGSVATWSGTDRLPVDSTAMFNTSTDIKYGRLYRHDTTTTQRETLFGIVQEGTFTLNNNCEGIPGWGVFGAEDVNTGSLDITCNIQALFRTTKALDLAEEGLDAGIYIVFARGSSGFILDIPLITVKTAPLNLALNTPINISLNNSGNESGFGYAASFQYFDYLPLEATRKQGSN